jgi:hypothetical protein
MSSIKACLKKAMPGSILAVRRRYLERKTNEFLRSASRKDIFTQVYDRAHWGHSAEQEERYYSGHGSHNPEGIDTYVSAVTKFLLSLDGSRNAVDLGCGDFSVGSRIRPYCGRYIACDIVEGLITRNRARYANDNVEFRALDIVGDDLPEGDVVFIRQVFQHLSNRDIENVLVRALAKYPLMVVTEHLPLSDRFVPNLDKLTGPKIRIDIGESRSGIVLTHPPFNLKPKQDVILCEVLEDNVGRNGVSRIRTNLYGF